MTRYSGGRRSCGTADTPAEPRTTNLFPRPAVIRRRIEGVTQAVAFGDNRNDVSMLEAADLAVAVANAPAEIQSWCQHVTHRHVDRGVVRLIEDYLAGL